jgi:predicted ATPase
VQEAAYESLLRRTRQELHGRVVDVLTEHEEAEPEVVARHAESAGRIDQAVAHYRRAGERAQSRSAHSEAILQLRHAIDLVGTRPQGAARDAREVELQLVLAPSLIAGRGYAHAETGAALERAQALCEALADTANLASTLVALSNVYVNRGDPLRSIALTERALASSEEPRDRYLINQARINAGLAEHYQGRFDASLARCEEAIAHYEHARERPALLRHANDQRVGALGVGAWNLWYLGHVDRALARAEQALAFARTLADPFVVAFAFFMATVVHRLPRDARAQRECAAEVISIGDAQGLAFFRGGGRIYHGLARVMLGEGANGLAEVSEGLALAAGTGNRGALPGLLASLAEGQRLADQPDNALRTVEGGLALAADTGQHFHDANLLRLKGDLLLTADPSMNSEAEALFGRALDVARAQGARCFELRAATSRARLWHSEGRSAEARAALAPLYGWFSEGHGSGDLIDAKALLEQLA